MRVKEILFLLIILLLFVDGRKHRRKDPKNGRRHKKLKRLLGPTTPPKFLVKPEHSKVVQNSIVSFFCKATGNPQPDIQWYQNGDPIKKKEFERRFKKFAWANGSVLRIQPVHKSDDGSVFACVADNSIEERAFASATLEVLDDKVELVAGYPRIEEGPALKAVEKGRSVTLICTAVGFPQPKVTWLKDCIPLKMDDSRIRQDETGHLNIYQAKDADEGKYECFAKNKWGVAYSYAATLYVKVRQTPPRITRKPKELYEVEIGQDLSLRCVASGAPDLPEVSWHEKVLNTDTGERVERTVEGSETKHGENIFILRNIQRSMVIFCKAQSELGIVEEQTQIKVKVGGDVPLPPNGLRANQYSSTWIFVEWEPSDRAESYIVRYRRVRSEDSPDVKENIKHTRYNITDLDPYVKYEIYVQARNGQGHSKNSVAIEVQTSEKAPGSPPYDLTAKVQSSDTVSLSFKEPKFPHGKIKSYRIYYTDNPHLNQIDLWTLKPLINNNVQPSTTITRLNTNRNYRFRIAAVNNAGVSPYSEILEVQTIQGSKLKVFLFIYCL